MVGTTEVKEDSDEGGTFVTGKVEVKDSGDAAVAEGVVGGVEASEDFGKVGAGGAIEII
ncbi:hypothetical protein AGMMS50222_10360 [Endomicrobiia bacterium]|nr:hypothetical protein AGMMS49556_08480 [Endomicrobiia bacterium]GHT77023.1 hypothetical protein AGMMS50222_10360 [Endomicrobiia bacterium]